MLKNRIITTMLWNGTTLVKGHNFINSRRAGSPITTIKIYNSRDVDEIIFFDIAKNQTNSNFDLDFIKQLTDECHVPITIGGGVKKISDIDNLLLSGADKVSLNSINYKSLSLLSNSSKKFGSQTIVVGIDYKKVDNKFRCFSNSGEKIEDEEPLSWAQKCADEGAGEIILTSISNDGLMNGYDCEMLLKISSKLNIPVVVSGGAGTYNHFLDAFNSGASAVAAASIYHFTERTPAEAKKFLIKNNIPIRINFK